VNEWTDCGQPTVTDSQRESLDLDRFSDQEAIKALQDRYEGWQCFKGVNYLCYGRLVEPSPQVLVRGEDWTDLGYEIQRAIARCDEGLISQE
jgi:hypothetical protein